jgi:hypothetical protein
MDDDRKKFPRKGGGKQNGPRRPGENRSGGGKPAFAGKPRQASGRSATSGARTGRGAKSARQARQSLSAKVRRAAIDRSSSAKTARDASLSSNVPMATASRMCAGKMAALPATAPSAISSGRSAPAKAHKAPSASSNATTARGTTNRDLSVGNARPRTATRLETGKACGPSERRAMKASGVPMA